MKKASLSLSVLFFASALITTQSFAQSRNGGRQGEERERDGRGEIRPERPQDGDFRPIPVPQQPIPQPQPQQPGQVGRDDRDDRREDRREDRRDDRRDDRHDERDGRVGDQYPQYPQQPHYPQHPQYPQYPQYPQGPYRPGPGHHIPRERQVVSHSLLSLRVEQLVRGGAQIDLMRLVRQQTGMTLEGAEIQRVIVEGRSLNRFGQPASVMVLLNGRIEGRESFIDHARGRAPIPLRAFEEVRRSLDILVRGEALIQIVHIRVGLVRPLRIR